MQGDRQRCHDRPAVTSVCIPTPTIPIHRRHSLPWNRCPPPAPKPIEHRPPTACAPPKTCRPWRPRRRSPVCLEGCEYDSRRGNAVSFFLTSLTFHCFALAFELQRRSARCLRCPPASTRFSHSESLARRWLSSSVGRLIAKGVYILWIIAAFIHCHTRALTILPLGFDGHTRCRSGKRRLEGPQRAFVVVQPARHHHVRRRHRPPCLRWYQNRNGGIG